MMMNSIKEETFHRQTKIVKERVVKFLDPAFRQGSHLSQRLLSASGHRNKSLKFEH